MAADLQGVVASIVRDVTAVPDVNGSVVRLLDFIVGYFEANKTDPHEIHRACDEVRKMTPKFAAAVSATPAVVVPQTPETYVDTHGRPVHHDLVHRDPHPNHPDTSFNQRGDIMPNATINAQIAALNTTGAPAVQVVTDAINASTLSASEKTDAHAALTARVKVINER